LKFAAETMLKRPFFRVMFFNFILGWCVGISYEYKAVDLRKEKQYTAGNFRSFFLVIDQIVLEIYVGTPRNGNGKILYA